MRKLKVYIASGWFTPDQALDLHQIKKVLDMDGVDYYSPKDEAEAAPNDPAEKLTEIFASNLKAIDTCDIVIANTRGKDMGTIFEAGYAFSIDKPIIYYFAELKKFGSFNLMLAQSGIAVVDNVLDLRVALRNFTIDQRWSSPYNGPIQ